MRTGALSHPALTATVQPGLVERDQDMPSSATVLRLSEWVQDARRRTLALIGDLSDEQLLGPRLSIINPLLWEIGHVAWFQERWVLRHACGRAPLRPDA